MTVANTGQHISSYVRERYIHGWPRTTRGSAPRIWANRLATLATLATFYQLCCNSMTLTGIIMAKSKSCEGWRLGVHNTNLPALRRSKCISRTTVRILFFLAVGQINSRMWVIG
jgi:hypothetical protein